MKNNLLYARCSKATLERIAALSPEHKARWGTMDAATMLRHCRAVTETILSGRTSTRRASLKERFWKTIILGIVRRLPKGRKQPPVIAAAMAAAPQMQFEEERQQLMEVVSRFAGHKDAINGTHPVFGPMGTKDWGVFAWVHLNHHLRQFGV